MPYAKKPEPPKPISWSIYKIAAKAVWLGAVEALDEATAIEKGEQADGDTAMTCRKSEITTVISSGNGRIMWPSGRKGAGSHEQ